MVEIYCKRAQNVEYVTISFPEKELRLMLDKSREMGTAHQLGEKLYALLNENR